MLVKLYSSAVMGIEAQRVTVEVDLRPGAKYFLVGLPDNAVKESLHRIESAIIASGFRMPRQRMIINLAPADLRKVGSAYDIAIALGILAASKQIPLDHLSQRMFVGELSLDGSLQCIKGVLPIAALAAEEKMKGLVVPQVNKNEAQVMATLPVLGVAHLQELVALLRQPNFPQLLPNTPQHHQEGSPINYDFKDVHGQESLKRALEIAAAGGHHVLMIGPPGSGKTMLAQRIPSILPPMSIPEAIETSKVHSVAGLLKAGQALLTQRPFRQPHHTISDVALVGGGAYPQPGEISLAHHGVLFLDELPEFKRHALEVLRQPIETRKITLARAKYTITLPAHFMLVAAMNPCPCGYLQHPDKACNCHPAAIHRYMHKISGPLLDRIDLQLSVRPVGFEHLHKPAQAEDSVTIRKRVIQARQRQWQRYEKTGWGPNNATLPRKALWEYCKLSAEGETLLAQAMRQLHLSARAYDKILKVARTIADIEGAAHIALPHLAEAIQYRSLDRSQWI
jgi:magnesium chelatase family protein